MDLQGFGGCILSWGDKAMGIYNNVLRALWPAVCLLQIGDLDMGYIGEWVHTWVQ